MVGPTLWQPEKLKYIWGKKLKEKDYLDYPATYLLDKLENMRKLWAVKHKKNG